MPDADFQSLVEHALAEGVSPRDLASATKACRSTVFRWAEGTARPSPNMQRPVVEAIQTLLEP